MPGWSVVDEKGVLPPVKVINITAIPLNMDHICYSSALGKRNGFIISD